MITYYNCIPMINQLNQIDKIYLMQWLSKQIALDENASQMEDTNQTGLCGIWQDSRNAEEISQEIINHRSISRDIKV